MRYKTAKFLSAWFGVAIVILCMTIVQSFVLIFMLGSVTGIMSSEHIMGISHEAVTDAASFAVKMTIPIAFFFAIVGFIVAIQVHGFVDKIIMSRVPAELMPKKSRKHFNRTAKKLSV